MDTHKASKWALITGASKGIGKAISHELAGRGYGLVLVARSADLLQALALDLGARYQVPVLSFPCDASQADTGPRLHDFCHEKGLPVSIVVNNAGIGVWERFAEAELPELMRMNVLNVDAVVRISHALLPLLLAQPKAHLLNVASTGAYQPIPCMALYGAGKAYVRSFTWALRHELRGSNVKVTCLSPGGVWTEFMEAAGNQEVSEKNRMFMMKADKCARIAVRGMLRGKGEVIPGWYNRVGALVTRLSPTAMSTRVAGRLFEKR